MSSMSRPLRWLLAISLALNLIAMGFAAGRLLGHKRHFGGPPPMSGPESLFAAADVVGKGAAMKQLLAARHDRFEQNRDALRQKRKLVAEAISREPFDPRALRLALASLRAQTEMSQAVLHETLVVFVEELSDEQRQRLADASPLQDRGPHGHGPRGTGPRRMW